MFIKSQKSWFLNDGIYKSRGSFLILLRIDNEIRGLVRYVELTQFGNFMMGNLGIKLPNKKYIKMVLSGRYGGDGDALCGNKYFELWNYLTKIPNNVFKSELINNWAFENIKQLRKLKR